MLKMKIMVLSGVLVLMTACSNKTDYQLFQTTTEPVAEKVIPNQKIEYKILPHDRLSINIYKYPELAPTAIAEKGVLIDSEGYISLPLIHRVKLSGLTQTQASRLLEDKYRTYLTDPTLNLEVLNKRIYVLGEVKNPGVITLDKEKLTMIEALAFAGDFAPSAVRNNVIVISHNAQDQMTIRKVDMTSFNTLSLTNMMIKPNDIIYVQPNSWKQFQVASSDIVSVLTPFTQILGTYASIKYLAD